MKQRRIAKTFILSVLPPTVLCLLYGLWLLLDAPGSLTASVYALLLLVLFIAAYVLAIWDAAERIRRTDIAEELPLAREQRIDAREMLRITFVLVCVKLITFLLAYAWELLVNGYSGTVFEMQHVWADHPLAARYISMANRGYSWETGGTGVYANLSVPPLFGLLVQFLSPSASTAIKVAFVLANLNSVLTGSAIYAFTVKEANRRRARLAVTFYCLFPSAFLMSCTLGDSTFMLLSLLTCYALKKRHFFAAGGLGAMASLAAPQGVALLVPALFEYDIYLREQLHGNKEERNLAVWIAEGASLLLIPVGLLMYMYKNMTVAGDPFMFVRMAGGYSWFFEQGAGLIRSTLTATLETLLSEYLPAVAALLAVLVLLLLTGKKTPPGLRLYVLFYILCIPNAGSAWPRLLYTCFPIILAAAEIASRKKWISVLMILCCSVLVLLRLGMYTLGWGAA